MHYITIDADNDGQRLDRFLKSHSEMNYISIQKSLRTGRIRVNKKRKNHDYRLQENDIISLPEFAIAKLETQKPKYQTLPENFIITQNDDFLIINKPAGLASQGGSKLNYHLDGLLEQFCNDDGVKPRLVHRLDKETSGVMLTARNRDAASLAVNAFTQKHITKYYLAIVAGKMPANQGVIDAPLLRTSQKVVVDEKGDNAITHYHLLSQKNNLALLLLMPITGRTHQLRVHLTTVNAMIIGDTKYQAEKKVNIPIKTDKHLYLHAYQLKWDKIDAIAPLPEYFTDLLERAELKMPSQEKLKKLQKLQTSKF